MLFVRTVWALIAIVALCAQSLAAPRLHVQIDNLIEAQPSFHAAELTSDAEFLRRIHLDLAGVPPTAKQVRAFLLDSQPDKRSRIVEELLTSPAHAARMQHVFDEMLMERKSGKHVADKVWRDYLRQSFFENKPWDEFVREVLSTDGGKEETRPAAKFLLDRELKMDDVTRDLGRIFLGRDLQCAQCHDHPSIDDYRQQHYYGLMAFLKRSYLFKDPKSGKTSIGEKAEGDVEFTSVFTQETGRTAPKMLELPPIADPPTAKEPYIVKKTKTTASLPAYSRRMQLANAITADANTTFRLNIANRIWAMMMGRGLVEPLDMMHESNPPSHPELLELLADSLLENDYDLRHLLREIALTKAYQRSTIVGPDISPDGENYSVGLIKPLSPEQLALSMLQATGKDPIEPASAADEKQLAVQQKYIDSIVKVFADGGQSTRFDAAAQQALFLRNDNLIQSWISIKGGLAERLASLDVNEVAEEFYLTVFARPPSNDESRLIEEFLKSNQDRDSALKNLLWAAVVSAEFRFNH